MNSTSKLFLLIFLPALLVLLIAFAFIRQASDNAAQQQIRQMMSSQWQIVADLDIPEDYSPVEHVRLRRLTAETFMRITIATQNGKILTDSALSYDQIMSADGHGEREEIRSAALGEPVFTVRYSRSTDMRAIYYAKMLDSGNILRISYPSDYYDRSAGTITAGLLTVFVLLTTAAAAFALIVSRKISRPFKELNDALCRTDCNTRLPAFNNPAMDSAVAAIYLGKQQLEGQNSTIVLLNEQLGYIIAHSGGGIILLDDNEGIVRYNENASNMLQCRLETGVDFIRQLSDIDVIKFLGDLPQGNVNNETMRIKGKTLSLSIFRTGTERLVVMNDISAGIVYNNYKMDLVGNLSHELRTPLTLILGASETVLKNTDMAPEARNRFLQTIHRNGMRLNELLSDMLALHKLENTGSGEMITDTADITEIIDELDELSKPLLGNKKINYRIEAGEVNVRASHILSILSNLVSNALKYSKGSEVSVSVLKAGREVTISVADQGPAIPKNERERIFERFYSLSRSRSRESAGTDYSGSGLGLSIVKHITRLYHGHIKLETNADGGNTFTVSFMEQAHE